MALTPLEEKMITAFYNAIGLLQTAEPAGFAETLMRARWCDNIKQSCALMELHRIFHEKISLPDLFGCHGASEWWKAATLDVGGVLGRVRVQRRPAACLLFTSPEHQYCDRGGFIAYCGASHQTRGMGSTGQQGYYWVFISNEIIRLEASLELYSTYGDKLSSFQLRSLDIHVPTRKYVMQLMDYHHSLEEFTSNDAALFPHEHITQFGGLTVTNQMVGTTPIPQPNDVTLVRRELVRSLGHYAHYAETPESTFQPSDFGTVQQYYLDQMQLQAFMDKNDRPAYLGARNQREAEAFVAESSDSRIYALRGLMLLHKLDKKEPLR